LALKAVFGKLLLVPKLCKNVSTLCVYDDGNSVLRGKKLLFVMQNLGIWGDNGDRGSKYVVESAIFGIADPDLPIHYATFMGLQ